MRNLDPDYNGWVFDGENTYPPIETPPCPLCGSKDTWTEVINTSTPYKRSTSLGMRHCRSCAGPKPENA